jgi:hypothetical protein
MRDGCRTVKTITEDHNGENDYGDPIGSPTGYNPHSTTVNVKAVDLQTGELVTNRPATRAHAQQLEQWEPRGSADDGPVDRRNGGRKPTGGPTVANTSEN